MKRTLRAALAGRMLALSSTIPAVFAEPVTRLFVNFDFDSPAVDTRKYATELSELAEIMKGNEWLHVLILAYADESGSSGRLSGLVGDRSAEPGLVQ